jgi:hypothetical protein
LVGMANRAEKAIKVQVGSVARLLMS